MKYKIYADNAATTRLDTDALHAMMPYLCVDFANPSQEYSFSDKAKNALSEARRVIAKCINASPGEIYFTSGGTESDNWAILGTLPASSGVGKTDIITSEIEHHAVLKACDEAHKRGHRIIKLPVDRCGITLPATLENAITGSTGLVSIMLANNELGTVEPSRELCTIAHQRGALFHTDAVQAVGHIPVDVKKLGVDLLSASAHKFNGPKGIGFLYIKEGTDISPYVFGGSQEFGFRAGTENVASAVGMAAALKKSCELMSASAEHLRKLEEIITSKLDYASIDYLRNGSSDHVPGILSLSFKNADGEAIFNRLDLMGIYVSTGAACDGARLSISHVIKAIRSDESYAPGTLRIALSRDNTEDDAETIANALCKILE